MKRSLAAIAVASGAVLGGAFAASAEAKPAEKRAKMDAHVAAVAHAERTGGTADALRAAHAERLDVAQGGVEVVIEAAGSETAKDAALAAGGEIEAEAAHLLQVRVPPSQLEALAADPAVAYVRRALVPRPQAVDGQGVLAGGTNAVQWHSRGWTGAAVKVAIVDVGFAGYATRQSQGDLPASLTAVNYCGAGNFTGHEHGTAVAEIVHEVAPRAQLYLICIDSEVTLAQASEYAIAHGIRIVNTSLGWVASSRGDGSGGPGTPDATVATARANGVLWVSAAGNEAESHWSGPYADSNGNAYLEWVPGDELNSILIPAGEVACVTLKWDDWPSSDQDYDLSLVASGAVVSDSLGLQTGAQPPVESLCYRNPTGHDKHYGVRVHEYASPSPASRMDLFVELAGFDLEHRVAAGSINEPASSPSALAVGALCWQDDSLEYYSSLGPTIDGRTKPDIAGQAAVSSATYGAFGSCADGWSGFRGTSAATPHVAGAAALAKQANPGFAVAELQSWLEGRAADLGAAGKDSSFGAGKLTLRDPQADLAVPVNPTVTSASHSPRTWSADSTVGVSFAGASDVGTGLDGYSFEWSTDPATAPDTVKDAEEASSGTTSAALAQGNSWYFHLRTADNWGNWSDPVHLGPFFVDLTVPANPTVASTSHGVGVSSTDDTVDLALAGATDAASGVDGFSYSWTTMPGTPDLVKDAEEWTTAVTSPALGHAQSWYFNVRTRDTAGNWSAAISAGPFVVADVTPPAVRALASSGRRATIVRLWYRAADDSGVTRERVQVYRLGRLLKTMWTPFRPRVPGAGYYVAWRAPRAPMLLKFCVRAWDASGKASVRSCASLRIR